MPKKNDPQAKEHYKGLTIKEGNLVDEAVRQVVEEGTLNKTKAAMKAYNPKNKKVAGVMGSQALAKNRVRRAFLAELDQRGVDDGLSINTFKRQFNASKPQRDYDTGEIVEVPDHAVQLRAVQEYHKLRGYYPDKKATVTKKEATLNLYANMTPQELEKVEQTVVERIRSLEENVQSREEKEETV